MDTERAVIGRALMHGGDPALRFCFANAQVERNRQGHMVRLVKSKKWMSIYDAVPAAMAISRASAYEPADWLAEPEAFERLMASIRAK